MFGEVDKQTQATTEKEEERLGISKNCSLSIETITFDL